MNPSSVKQIQEALEPLAQKLGQGAEFVYQAYYKQTLINGVQDIALGVLGFATLILLTRKTYKIVKKFNQKEADYDNENRWMAWGIATAVLWFILGLWSLGGLINGPQKLINPHYFTVNMILEDVRGDQSE